MHVHVRNQQAGMGHLPSWDPEVMASVVDAIRQACPGVIINLTTGVVGKDISGPLNCIRRVKPEIAACNAGSLNYLKLKEDGSWAWPPMVFDNPVAKVQQFLDVMQECGTHPEFECFDVGILRSVSMYLKAGLFSGVPEVNFVMGVASGMPCDADLLALLPQALPVPLVEPGEVLAVQVVLLAVAMLVRSQLLMPHTKNMNCDDADVATN